MRTERPKPVALFLFAHQDDEFGVFQRIIECRHQGLRVHCAYLTSGATATSNATPAQRNAESIHVLTQLGVVREDIMFAGELLAIPDASLPNNLPRAGQWIRQWFATFSHIESIHVTAWEGGHHDHDALHALVVHIAQERDLLPCVRQYSLYHCAGCPHPFFKVLSPLAENGPVRRSPMSWPMRFRFLRFCLSYSSQRTTWIGLFPFVLFHFLTRGVQTLQPVQLERVRHRPHPGPLYYEKREFFTWPEMTQKIAKWRADPSDPSGS